MCGSQKNRHIFWQHKRHIVSVLIALKQNRKAIVDNYNNDALHDFRVAVRKLLSLNNLFEKTFGFCFGEELKAKLKTTLALSSQLRDLEELMHFAPELEGDMMHTRQAYLKEFIESIVDSALEHEVFCGYKSLYETMKAQKNKLLHFKDAALEVVIESMGKTSKEYAKIANGEKIDFDKMHYIRKRCKRYRYQLDFLFLGSNEGSLICKRIQDKFGKVNDLRMWLKMVDEGGVIFVKISAILKNALEEAKTEASVFADKKYCDSLAVELRRRMAVC